ncbi:MAG: transrane sensor, partial [Myxococcales bacterium]|nr:transrane sensor [Myxococcales bacterium]
MGEHVSLDRLGGHVSGSLEEVRTSRDAAARVRARLAAGEGRARVRPMAPRLRVRTSAALGALAVAATVLVFAFAAWRESHRALTFVVGSASANGSNGESPRPSDVGAFLAAPADAELPIAFSDGTHVSIAAGARARVAEVTPRGARLLVENGVVHASVVHRSDTRWLVDAGPFEVKVTGTRFDVAWQPGEQAIVVTLHEGSVVVTGCGLADGQRVSGGQQLHASCKTGAATLSPLAALGTESPASVPAIAPAIVPAIVLGGPPEPTTTAAASLPDAPVEHATIAPSVVAPSVVTATSTATATAMAAAPAVTMARNANVSAAERAALAASAPLTTATAAELLARANAERYAGRFEAATETLDAVRRRFR